MKRQGLNVNLKQLRKLIKEMETENQRMSKQFNIKVDNDKWLIPIINKDGTSDGWEIEE